MCASVRYRPPETAEIGIFGGTGNYDPSYLQDAKQFKVYTPYGPPSDLVTVGWVKDRKGACRGTAGTTQYRLTGSTTGPTSGPLKRWV